MVAIFDQDEPLILFSNKYWLVPETLSQLSTKDLVAMLGVALKPVGVILAQTLLAWLIRSFIWLIINWKSVLVSPTAAVSCIGALAFGWRESKPPIATINNTTKGTIIFLLKLLSI